MYSEGFARRDTASEGKKVKTCGERRQREQPPGGAAGDAKNSRSGQGQRKNRQQYP
jgi:hypothetical protein